MDSLMLWAAAEGQTRWHLLSREMRPAEWVMAGVTCLLKLIIDAGIRDLTNTLITLALRHG